MGHRNPRLGNPVGVEPLEGRALLSYLVVPRAGALRPVHVGDARHDEPLFSNGLGGKPAPRFFPLYTGPRRPELNGVRASAYVSGSNLVLSGTVAGPIVRNPQGPGQGAVYAFGIDRGGAPKRGPFPGRPHVRFDALVIAEPGQGGVNARVQLNNTLTDLTQAPTIKALPASAVAIRGAEITVTVPLSALPSTGHAVDQWNVTFFTRNPAQQPDARSIASVTPEFNDFQVHVKPPALP